MNLYVLGLLVGAVFYLIAYVALDNFIFAAIPSAFALIYFIFIAEPQVNKYKKKIAAFKKTYQFINNYLVALSIQPSMNGAFEHSYSTLDSDFTDKVGNLSSLGPVEKIKYLSNYFPFHSYQLFLDLVNMWQEQGGDILKMSNYLTNNISQTSDYITICQQMFSKKVVEFSILWAITLCILIILRFALSSFYSMLITKPIFVIGVISIFVFCLFTCQVLISKITKIEIRGWEKNGK